MMHLKRISVWCFFLFLDCGDCSKTQLIYILIKNAYPDDDEVVIKYIFVALVFAIHTGLFYSTANIINYSKYIIMLNYYVLISNIKEDLYIIATKQLPPK